MFDDSFDCIVGLAYQNMAVPGTIPILDNIINRQVLKMNVFSFYFSKGLKDEEAGLKSKLVFGTIDSSDITGSITWFPVMDKNFWALELVDILLDGVSLDLCSDR